MDANEIWGIGIPKHVLESGENKKLALTVMVVVTKFCRNYIATQTFMYCCVKLRLDLEMVLIAGKMVKLDK